MPVDISQIISQLARGNVMDCNLRDVDDVRSFCSSASSCWAKANSEKLTAEDGHTFPMRDSASAGVLAVPATWRISVVNSAM